MRSLDALVSDARPCRRLTLADGAVEIGCDGAIPSWKTHSRGVPDPVPPGLTGAIEFLGVRSRHRPGARDATPMAIDAACGIVEVADGFERAAEPVGRGAPGVALVRLVRCLDAPLEVSCRIMLGDLASPVRWMALNGIAFGYLGDRKVTVDGGELDVGKHCVLSRLFAPTKNWAALTIAVDGHLPADVDVCRRLVLPQGAVSAAAATCLKPQLVPCAGPA